MVHVGLWYLTYTAAISFPLRVLSFTISTFSFIGTSGIESFVAGESFPVEVSETVIVYDGGCGGKKANLAAIEDVTPPMVALIHKDGGDGGGGGGGEISD